MEIHIRNSTAEDADFAFAVVKETMRDYAIETWGTWLEEESRSDSIEGTESGVIQIIEYESNPIGTLLVDEGDEGLLIKQIYILPAYQNRGIGSKILKGLIEQAIQNEKHINLWVLRVNPARKLYERLGFTIKEETDERIYMVHKP